MADALSCSRFGYLLQLQLIFLEPGIEYVLNPVAAEKLHHAPAQFKKEVRMLIDGYYDRMLRSL